MRTITAPGVEIKEFDISQYLSPTIGTKVLITGFANRGEDLTPIELTSRASFLTTFGEPTNEAERYFYAAALECIQQNGTLIAAKLPYDNTASGKYVSFDYNVSSTAALSSASGNALSAVYAEDATILTYSQLVPTANPVSSSMSDIDALRTGASTLNANVIKIIDKTRTGLAKNKDGVESIGIIPIVTTAINALAVQNILTIAGNDYTDFCCVSGAVTKDGTAITSADVGTQFIDSNIRNNSLSNMVASLFNNISYDEAGNLDREYLNNIGIVVVRPFIDATAGNKLNFSILESFVGSLNVNDKDPTTGTNKYIGNIVNNNSKFIELYSNVTDAGILSKNNIFYVKPSVAGILGFTAAELVKTISTPSILTSLTNILDKVKNINEYELDILCDAGVSNIVQYIDSVFPETNKGLYDPTSTAASNWKLESRTDTESFRNIISVYDTFCSKTRKDLLFIADGLRTLCLEGSAKYIRPSKPENTLDNTVLAKIKYMSGINTSYGCGYCNWFKVVDEFTGNQYWLPPSIKAMGIFIFTDKTSEVWEAPAGLNRGIVSGVVDIAFNPDMQQAGAIYSKSWNYAVNYPLDGIVLEGQKTFQTKPSAFDRVNVRKLFLNLERNTYKAARYFVYQGNNQYNRNKLIDTIQPVFENAKLKGGVYDFRLVCNDKNNTPDVIDNNEMRVAAMIKPTKTAEFITVNFYALKTGGSFDEVIL